MWFTVGKVELKRKTDVLMVFFGDIEITVSTEEITNVALESFVKASSGSIVKTVGCRRGKMIEDPDSKLVDACKV